MAPVDDLSLVHEETVLVGGGEARRGAHTAVDVGNRATGPADHVVVIIAHPRLVSRDRTRRLDAPEEPGGGQRSQNVVDGLSGNFGQDGADSAENRVGVGMWTGLHRLENRHPGTGDPQLGGP